MSLTYEYGGQAQPFTPASLSSLWYWTNAEPENVTLSGNPPEQTAAVNLAGSNNFFNTQGTGGGWQEGVSVGGYSTDRPLLALEQYEDTTQIGRQAMSQETSMGATGAFYLVAAFLNTRVAGSRYIHGTEGGDYTRINQEDNHILIAFGGSETEISADESVPTQVVLEVWRDSNDNITVQVNGSDITSGTPNISGTFNLNGWGGGENAGSSAWDDYLFELIACDDLPSESDRQNTRNYLNNRWGLY